MENQLNLHLFASVIFMGDGTSNQLRFGTAPLVDTFAPQLLVLPAEVYSNDNQGDTFTPVAAPAPEPATWLPFAFMGLGAMGLILKAKRRRA